MTAPAHPKPPQPPTRRDLLTQPPAQPPIRRKSPMGQTNPPRVTALPNPKAARIRRATSEGGYDPSVAPAPDNPPVELRTGAVPAGSSCDPPALDGDGSHARLARRVADHA